LKLFEQGQEPSPDALERDGLKAAVLLVHHVDVHVFFIGIRHFSPLKFPPEHNPATSVPNYGNLLSTGFKGSG
jgi:hypothetical protein